MYCLAYLTLLASWIAGVVMANGFWSTLLAVIFPFWSWYLVVERGMQMAGII